MTKNNTSILITGASSGLGKALALEYASAGVTLYLTGRNKARLEEVKQLAEVQNARVHIAIIDVTDASAMQAWIIQAEQLDLVIANAGISGGTGGEGVHSGESADQVRHIFATNMDGVLNTVLPAVEIMKKQGHGQIAVISSMAGFRGLPSAPAYSASKGAVKLYGEALRGELLPANIKVNVICPGYIRTPMTDVNNFPMPMLMSAEKAARIIRKGLERNKARIAFPFPIYMAAWLLGALPVWLTDPLLARLPKKA